MLPQLLFVCFVALVHKAPLTTAVCLGRATSRSSLASRAGCDTIVQGGGDSTTNNNDDNKFNTNFAIVPMMPITKGTGPSTFTSVARPAPVWGAPDVRIYHLHISKTGGTTLEKHLRKLAVHNSLRVHVKVCPAEKHPFSNPPLFANPHSLCASQCGLISAEGRMRDVAVQFGCQETAAAAAQQRQQRNDIADNNIANIDIINKNLNIASASTTTRLTSTTRKIIIITMLRHPVLRTLSQFGHDRAMERRKDRGKYVHRQNFTRNAENIVELYKHFESSEDCNEYSKNTINSNLVANRHDKIGVSSGSSSNTSSNSTPQDKHDSTENSVGVSASAAGKRVSPHPKLCAKGVVPPRYSNWQIDRLLWPGGDTAPVTVVNVTRILSQLYFIGMTDYYRTSLCLFYHTFGLANEFARCGEETITAYNARTSTSSTNSSHIATAKRSSARSGPDSGFENKPAPESRDGAHAQLRVALRRVGIETASLITRHAAGDMRLWVGALDLFWRRVAVMEAKTGRRFGELPQRYREKDVYKRHISVL